MTGLSGSEINNFDHLYIRLAVLIQFRSVTDIQTDGQNCYINIVRCIHVWTECRILLQKYYASSWQGRVRTLRPLFVYATDGRL